MNLTTWTLFQDALHFGSSAYPPKLTHLYIVEVKLNIQLKLGIYSPCQASQPLENPLGSILQGAGLHSFILAMENAKPDPISHLSKLKQPDYIIPKHSSIAPILWDV